MFGGWKVVPSLFALPAAAVLLAGGIAASPAKAADLGGDCCADLEERVAELEATTVRKGNRKVSVTVSGFVSQSVFIWDDGDETNVYVGDTNGNTLGSNFSFSGSATIAPTWTAGFNITVEAKSSGDLTGQTQINDQGLFGGQLNVLVSSMYIKSEKYGKISWGQQSQASDNTALLPDLSGTIIQANYVYAFHGGSMFVRAAGVGGLGGLTGFQWGTFNTCATAQLGVAMDCNGAVTTNVRYDSPTFAGFSVSASWGEDDFWDVAVNYAGQFGDVKVKAAYGFTQMHDERYIFGGGGNTAFEQDVDFHQVGASALHVPTGLFVYGAYVTEEVDSTAIGNIYNDGGWYVKAGIRQKWNSLGETVFYGEYGQTDSKIFAGGIIPDPDLAEFERYGVGVVQYVDAAAMQLHALWKHNEVELDATTFPAGPQLDDLDMFIVGGTIFF